MADNRSEHPSEDWDPENPQFWSIEHIITMDLHVVVKYVAGDLIIDYRPLYNNPQFKEALMELLSEYGFPDQELEHAELSMQGCPPIVFEGVDR